jgi:hypothetical protein
LIKTNIKNKMSRDEIKKLIKKFDTIKILRTILHGQHIFWGGEERKEEGEKLLSKLFCDMDTLLSKLFCDMDTNTCRPKGYQHPLGGTTRATKRALVPPSYWHVHLFFCFLNYRQTKTLLTTQARKSRLKNQKYPFILGKKLTPRAMW